MTGPRARSIDEVAAPYENFLVPMPAPGMQVCITCHSAVFDGYTRCYPCKQAREGLHGLDADAVASVALAPSNEQFARTLYAYKDTNIRWAVRQPLLVALAAVLYKWLALHESCLASAAGAMTGGFDVITSVPSTSGRVGVHPLQMLLTGIVVGSKDRYLDLLEVNRTDLHARDLASDRFAARQQITGSALVIDDSWVRGVKPQAAAAAVKAAGATSVAVLTIGRWFNTDYPLNVPWLREARKPGWNWATCCVH